MRWHRIQAHAIGALPDVDVDLDELPGDVIAITGQNGAGKSTLLELLVGALYRELPTRGSLSGVATARDSWFAVEVTHAGRRYRLQQNVDQVSGKGEMLVVDVATGIPLFESAKVRDGDAWVAAHLPARDVVLAGQFSAQGSGGFLALKEGDAKGVILRALGVEGIEARAALARDRLRAARQVVEVLAGRLLDFPDGNIDTEHARQVDAERELLDVAHQLQLARVALAEAEAAAKRADEHRTQLAAVGRRVDAARSSLADIEARITNNRAILADAGAIRDAVARDGEMRKAREEAIARRAERERVATAATVELETALRAMDDAARRLRELGERQAGVDALLKGGAMRATVEAAVARIPVVAAKCHEMRAAAETTAAELDAARREQLVGADARIGGLRQGLQVIADSFASTPSQTLRNVAGGALLEDTGRAEKIAQLPDRIAKLVLAQKAAATALAHGEAELAKLEQQAARLTDVERFEAERDDLRARAAAAGTDGLAAQAARDGAKARVSAEDDALIAAVREVRALDVHIEQLAEKVKRAPRLDDAESRLAELEPRAIDARRELAAAEAAAAETVGATAADVGPARDEVARLERSERTVRADVAALTARVEAIAKSAGLRAELAARESDVADLTLVVEALGRDGVQALEIDAAGPELSAIATELLHEAYGPRWTVTIETTRASADGKRQLEDCRVVVLDTERGTDGGAARLSGGEKVIVAEAVALALSVVATRRAGGGSSPTLVRDESGAALDATNALAYVGMLRRAAKLIGASKVLLVSHSPDVAAACDSRLVIADGRVEVRA